MNSVIYHMNPRANETTGPMDLSDILEPDATAPLQDHFPAVGHSLEWVQHHEIPAMDRLDGYAPALRRPPHYVTLAQLLEACAVSVATMLAVMIVVVVVF